MVGGWKFMSAVQNLHWNISQVEAYKGKLFFFFFGSLTKLHTQWASERVQGFTANFCYVEYLCVLSRSRISELSMSELSLQNTKWLFKLLSHRFSLQEMELRLCPELPPAPTKGVGKPWAGEGDGGCFQHQKCWDCVFIFSLGCVFVSGSVGDQGCPVLPCTCVNGEFPC